MDDISPQGAVRLARVLFPKAFKILAYRPGTREAHTMSGGTTVEFMPAMVVVQLGETPASGYTLNNPKGEGHSLREAVAALSRCTYIVTNEAREKVRKAIGYDDTTAGVLTAYTTVGRDVPDDDRED